MSLTNQGNIITRYCKYTTMASVQKLKKIRRSIVLQMKPNFDLQVLGFVKPTRTMTWIPGLILVSNLFKGTLMQI